MEEKGKASRRARTSRLDGGRGQIRDKTGLGRGGERGPGKREINGLEFRSGSEVRKDPIYSTVTARRGLTGQGEIVTIHKVDEDH